MAREGSYTIKTNKINKTLDIQVIGTFTEEKAQQFLDEYQRNVSLIKADEFTLKFNCSALDVVTPAMVPVVENCLKIYKSSNFKKVEAGIKSKPVLNMQLKRLGRNTGMTNFEVVEIY